MRHWFLRFLAPWWGVRVPRIVSLDVLVASVVALGSERTAAGVETLREVSGAASARTLAGRDVARTIVAQTTIARTVQEVI